MLNKESETSSQVPWRKTNKRISRIRNMRIFDLQKTIMSNILEMDAMKHRGCKPDG